MTVDLDNRSLAIDGLLADFSTIKQILTCEGQSLVQQFDISMSQIGILMYLMFNGSKTMTDVARRLGISRGATTQLMDSLITRGYIHREKSGDDGRIVIVELSDDGYELVKKIQQSGTSRVMLLLETLTDDELELFGSTLSKLADRVRGNSL